VGRPGVAARTATSALPREALDALLEATNEIAGVLDLDAVLQRIVDQVRHLIDAEYAALGIPGDDDRLERFLTSGIDDETRRRIGSPPRGHGLLGLIVREQQSFRIPEIGRHEASYGFPPEHPPMSSFLGVPIIVHGRALGNFYLTNKRGAKEFSPEDQLLVELFALRAGIAIENAHLHERVQRLAVVEERERIGRDLHDGIIQGIYAVALSLEDVPDLMSDDPAEAEARVDRAIDSLNLSIRDIRNFILGLQSEFVGGADVGAGLARLADEFRHNTAIDIELDVSAGAAAGTLPTVVRVNLLQMAREILSNAARHSRAATATVTLAAERDDIVLAIRDDGVGFDPRATQASGHLGLTNLADRARAIGADLTIASGPGEGTKVIVRVPPERRSQPQVAPA
jgi:signal transduction histidine kinase